MEQQQQRRRWVGWAALAVGMLALGLVLGGQGFGMRSRQMEARAMAWQQAQPVQPVPPGAQAAPQAPNLPNMPQAPNWDRGPRFSHQGMPGASGAMEMRIQHGGPIGGILGLVGGLFKLVFWGFAIYLLYLVWRDRQRDKGAKGGGGGGSSDQSSARPGPEQPPYTGMTTSL